MLTAVVPPQGWEQGVDPGRGVPEPHGRGGAGQQEAGGGGGGVPLPQRLEQPGKGGPGNNPVSRQGSEGSFTDSPKGEGRVGGGGGSSRHARQLAGQAGAPGFGSPGASGSPGAGAPGAAPRQLPSVPAGAAPPSMQAFTYGELRDATGGFAKGNLLGEGGFGCVYKGKLGRAASRGPGKGRGTPRHGKSPGPMVDVAVKLLDEGSLQGQKEWLVSASSTLNCTVCSVHSVSCPAQCVVCCTVCSVLYSV